MNNTPFLIQLYATDPAAIRAAKGELAALLKGGWRLRWLPPNGPIRMAELWVSGGEYTLGAWLPFSDVCRRYDLSAQ